MHIIDEVKLGFDDVMIRPKRSSLSSRSEIDLVKHYKLKYSNLTLDGYPLIASNLDCTGTFAMDNSLEKLNCYTILHKFYDIDQLEAHFKKKKNYYSHTFVSIGIKELDKLEELNKRLEGRITCICLDVANGYSEAFVDFVKLTREKFPNQCIMAGNVTTGDMTEQLILSGADIVKIFIGTGNLCLTSSVTGVGYPPISAIVECADAAHGLGGLVCADGGHRKSGDVCKSFACNADMICLGSMLAGTEECDGEWDVGAIVVDKKSKVYEKDGFGFYIEGVPEITNIYEKKFLKVYGMSSIEANEKYNGGLKEYRAAEGRCTKVPFKGKVENVIQEILGGLRSCCTYVGAASLKDLPKCATLIRVNK